MTAKPLSLDDAYKISQIISAIGLLITGFGTLALLCFAHYLAKSSKRAEILAHCNSRFEDILNLRLKTAVQRNPIIFYNRFWALQFDQFTYWLHGFVAEEMFRFWMMERHEAWCANEEFGSINYRQGWEQAMAGWTYTEFMDFMKIVHEQSADRAIDSYKARKRCCLFWRRKGIV